MFSGIVDGLYRVVHLERGVNTLHYSVDLKDRARGLQIGASVSINGVCQTVVNLRGTVASFDVIPETLSCTNLAELKVGEMVNAERSLRLGDEIGGHILAGHVLTTAKLAQRVASDAQLSLFIEPAKNWSRYLMPKGYIALEGVSLTVAKIDPFGGFWVHLIPETQRRTNLGQKNIDDVLNIEIDCKTQAIVDTTLNFLQRYSLQNRWEKVF